MPARFTKLEEIRLKKEIKNLYICENLSIREVGKRLGISQTGVYVRLKRLGISTCPQKKLRFCNKKEVQLPRKSKKLAELVGILLGDGHIGEGQIWISGHKYDDQIHHKYIHALCKERENFF